MTQLLRHAFDVPMQTHKRFSQSKKMARTDRDVISLHAVTISS
jgi:hypothetical protein